VLEERGVLRAHQVVRVERPAKARSPAAASRPPSASRSPWRGCRLPPAIAPKVEIRGKWYPVRVVKPNFVRHGKPLI
jgi:aminomethyltransferase